jgi:hypothetical protein
VLGLDRTVNGDGRRMDRVGASDSLLCDSIVLVYPEYTPFRCTLGRFVDGAWVDMVRKS